LTERKNKQEPAIELWGESVSFYTSAASNCFARVIITWTKELELASKDFAINSLLNKMCLLTTFVEKVSMDTISSSACRMGTHAFASVATDNGDSCYTKP